MEKQNPKTRNKNFSLVDRRYARILFAVASLVLVVFALFIIFSSAPIYSPAQADEGPYLLPTPPADAVISTEVSSDISIIAMTDATFYSDAAMITTSTNNYTGYKLSASLPDASTGLSHIFPGVSATIPSITTEYTADDFPINHWGVSIDNINYLPLPTFEDDPLVVRSSSVAVADQTSSLYVGTRVSDDQTFGSYTGRIVLTSVANPAEYKITFGKNTTDIVLNFPGSQQGMVSNEAYTLPSNIPSRDGYTFLGWSESPSATAAAYESGDTFYLDATRNNTDIKLYAVWRINTYTVTINSDGTGYGSVDKSFVANVPYSSAISASGNVITINGTVVIATPTANNAQYSYTFNNWTNGCGNTMPDGPCTITANFSRTTNRYTITWNANGGSVSTSTTTKDYGSQIGTLPTPTRTNYSFKGWFTAASGGSQISAVTTVTGNATYYAQWEAIWVDRTNTINFNSFNELTDNYSIQIGACGHSNTYCDRPISFFSQSSYASGGYLYWKAVQTDVYPKFVKSIDTSKNHLKSWEIRFIWDGSTSWMEPVISISSTAGKALYIWPRYDHYSSYQSYYIFYNNYGTSYNKKALVSTGWGSNIIGSGTMASTNSWHTIKFTNTSGTTWSAALDGVTLGSSDLGGNISWIDVNLLLGWWQTDYPMRIDYIKEEYSSLAQ